MKFLFLFVVLCTLPAISQVNSGTVIFFQFTKSELVLAADSRTTTISPDGTTTQNDHQCKIAAVNSKVVISIAGISRKQGWQGLDLLNVARTVMGEVAINRLDDLTAVAGKWADAVTPFFEREARINPQWYKFPAPSGILSTIIFATTDQHGRIIIAAVNIHRLPREESHRTACEIKGYVHDGTEYAMHASAGWGNDVIIELHAASTERAKGQSALMHRIQFAKTVDDMKFTTEHLCLLAAEWAPQEVGGAIDQIYLGHSGIEWLRRKQGCPED